jgi:hypothetical protein
LLSEKPKLNLRQIEKNGWPSEKLAVAYKPRLWKLQEDSLQVKVSSGVLLAVG